MTGNKQFVDTNDEIRRKRLARLCEATGGLQAVAERVETNWQYLYQILNRRLLSKARKDGTRSTVALGDELARRLEEAHGLKPGWLDWPFEAVPFAAWTALSDSDRGYVQKAMVQALEERLGSLPREAFSATSLQVPGLAQTDERPSEVLPQSTAVTAGNTNPHGQEAAFGSASAGDFIVGRGTKNEPSTDRRADERVQKPRTRRDT